MLDISTLFQSGPRSLTWFTHTWFDIRGSPHGTSLISSASSFTSTHTAALGGSTEAHALVNSISTVGLSITYSSPSLKGNLGSITTTAILGVARCHLLEMLNGIRLFILSHVLQHCTFGCTIVRIKHSTHPEGPAAVATWWMSDFLTTSQYHGPASALSEDEGCTEVKSTITAFVTL